MIGVELILRAAGLIHAARIPVAVLRLALRPPVRPDAELGVAKPLRALVLLQRIPCRLEFARGHRLGGGADDDEGDGIACLRGRASGRQRGGNHQGAGNSRE